MVKQTWTLVFSQKYVFLNAKQLKRWKNIRKIHVLMKVLKKPLRQQVWVSRWEEVHNGLTPRVKETGHLKAF